jgi:hypothetical protein
MTPKVTNAERAQSTSKIAKKTTSPRTSPQQTPATSEREEKIRNLAYQKWEAAGCPVGDGLAFWLEAERECRQQSRAGGAQ